MVAWTHELIVINVEMNKKKKKKKKKKNNTTVH